GPAREARRGGRRARRPAAVRCPRLRARAGLGMTVRLEPASSFSSDQLADLFTRGYEGYFVPMRVDATGLEAMVAAFDTDLGRSRTALDGDEPVGFAFLAVRGDRSWVGGVGVVAAARRRGIGRALMESILAEAPSGVQLEVIEANDPARRLYEDLGF